MGKMPNGILGPLIGSIGNVTGYMLNGEHVTRIKDRKITHFTPNQLGNQQRMAVLNEFFNFMGSFLKVGFGIAALGTNKNYHNLATAYNKKNALKGEYRNVEMDYAKVLLSTGNLTEAQNPIVEAVTDGLKFSWDLSAVDRENGQDQVMMLAFGTVSKKVAYILYGPKRIEGQATLPLEPKIMQEPLETYISFISPDRLQLANSVYTGRVEPI